ncbi:uncharacterized protein LOC123564088 [Mercenaria mercenaria]|uniref:uncharacterized protein LOC123564088 n=1 Tax=Mercenaria mercenaria TaxID=6596 RepID=UPI00234F9C42|nr:uncharacterized protein LOC123564088 [Mercenaria mercenaria]
MNNVPVITVDGLGEKGGSEEEHHGDIPNTAWQENGRVKLDPVHVGPHLVSSGWMRAVDAQGKHTLPGLNPKTSTGRRKSMFVRSSVRNSSESAITNIGRVPLVKKNSLPESFPHRKSSVHENIGVVRRRLSGLKAEIDVSAAFVKVLTRHGSARPRTPRKPKVPPLLRFKGYVRLVLICVRLCKYSHENVEASKSEYLSIIQVSEDYVTSTADPDGIFFDPTLFRANKEQRLPADARKILQKDFRMRTEKEIDYLHLVLRSIKAFAEYPNTMQKQLCRVGWYEVCKVGFYFFEFKRENSISEYDKKLLDDRKIGRKTITDELDNKMIKDFTLTEKDIRPMFVQVQFSKEANFFQGLTKTVFPEQAESFSVVSNGAECIMISKKFFLEKANENTMYHLRQVETLLPPEEELQTNLQDFVDWKAHRVRVYNRLVQNKHKRTALKQQFPTPGGQYCFRTGPTVRID